jgi:hypothetical protein
LAEESADRGRDHAHTLPWVARTDTASRVIGAPRERVYAAFLDPDALAVWLPPGGMTGRFERFDAQPGGSYRMVLTYADASAARGKATADSDVVEARFLDMVPDLRVVQAVDFVCRTGIRRHHDHDLGSRHGRGRDPGHDPSRERSRRHLRRRSRGGARVLASEPRLISRERQRPTTRSGRPTAITIMSPVARILTFLTKT